jgi:hypothetical protein
VQVAAIIMTTIKIAIGPGSARLFAIR